MFIYYFQPSITLCTNIDEMNSYAHIAWTLAGKMSKTVYSIDYAEDVDFHEAAAELIKYIIDERLVSP